MDAIEFPASRGSPTILCLHGYGADAADLAGLAMNLDLAGPARWIFPEAPLRIGPFRPGRAWFPLPEEDLIRIQTTGATLDYAAARPNGLGETLSAVGGFIEALGEPWDRLVLGGFSQGAMVALEATLHAPAPPRGLFLLSTALVDEATVRSLAPAKRGIRFFQSHGTVDPLLPYEGACRLADALRESGWLGKLFSFDGPHAVPAEAAAALGKYLDSTLASGDDVPLKT